MARLFIFIFIISNQLTGLSQCIDKEKITYGGDWGFTDYIHRCPTYSFAFDGDTSKNWNTLNDPIDIMQAPKNILPLKQNVENKIKEFAGESFFSKLKFDEVEVVYADRLKAFLDSGRQDVTLKYCKAKYFFYYNFIQDTLMRYNIGIAVNAAGKIISPFSFPSKKDYKPFDTSFTYCKLINIARQVKKDIEPIESISLEFDSETRDFYYLVTEKIKEQKAGLNYINHVRIDASDLTKAMLTKTKVYIDY